jgi:hypothetical protein
MKRLLIALMILACCCGMSFGADIQTPGQTVCAADDAIIVAALADHRIMVYSIALIATSGTSVNVSVFNGDKYLLGDATNLLTLDKDGVDGPAGIVLPYNERGWFQTDTANEALQLNMSASTPVIVIINYAYLPF